MYEPPLGSPLERITIRRAVELYCASLRCGGARLPAELSSMVAMLPEGLQSLQTARSLSDEATASVKSVLGPSHAMLPARSVRSEAAARSMTVESFVESLFAGGGVAGGRGPDAATTSRARRLATFRRSRPSRETEAWLRLAEAWHERYGASIDEDALVLNLSPVAVLLKRRAAAAQLEANALGEATATFLLAVAEARQRIDTAVPLDAELVQFSQIAIDFDRSCEALDARVRDWWHQARRLGHKAAMSRDALTSGGMRRALVICANDAFAWIVARSSRRRGTWIDVVRLLAFHGWNERLLVGERALAVNVADLALPSGTTRGSSRRLRQASHRLQQLCRDEAARRAKEPETGPSS
jgi:hypothetical protein